MNIFQIPNNSPKKDQQFIGLIDSSGSQLERWKILVKVYNKYLPENALTITFSSSAQVNTDKLEDSLLKYGGEMTNVINGFQELEKQLDQCQKGSVTVLYITDGGDNYDFNFDQRIKLLKGNTKNLEINFLILGIGENFKLNQALKLKSLYHTGDNTISSHYWIKIEEEKEYLQTFMKINKDYFIKGEVKTNIEIKQFPWEQPKNTFYGGSLVISSEKYLKIANNDLNPLSKAEFIKYLGVYSSQIENYLNYQLKTNNPSTIEWAEISVKLLNELLNNTKQQIGLDFTEDQLYFEKKENQTFYQIVYENFLTGTHQQIKNQINKIELISVSNNVYRYNELVTIQQIKQKTVEVFKNKQKAEIDINFLYGNSFQNEFEQIYLNFNKNNLKSDNENMKVLLQNDFQEALKLPLNYYVICKSLEVKGYPVMFKPHDLHLVNPWLSQIKDINLDIQKITTKNIFDGFGTYKHFRKNQKALYFNSVLPVFSEKDKPFQELIFSNLYQLVLNNNVTKKSDVDVKEAFLAFLGNCLIYNIINQDNDQLSKEILETIQFLTPHIESFSVGYQQFLKSPYDGFIQNVKENLEKLKKFDPQKSLTYLFLAIHEKKIDDKVVSEILKTILYFYFKYDKSVRAFKNFQLNFLQGKNAEETIKKVKEVVREQFKFFKTLGDFKSYLCQKYVEILEKSQIDMTLKNKSQYSSLYTDQINPLFIEKIMNKFGFEKWSEQLFSEIMFISEVKITDEEFKNLSEENRKNLIQKGSESIHKQSIEKYVSPRTKVVSKDTLKGELKYVMTRKEKDKAPVDKIRIKISNHKLFQTQEFKQLKKELKLELEDFYRKTHPIVMPINFQKLEKLTKFKRDLKKRFEKKPLQINIDNYLIENACMNKDCYHYLKPTKRIDHHYNINEKIVPPRFHILIKQNYEESKEKIAENIKEFFQEEYRRPLNLEEYKMTEKGFLDIIEKIKTEYMKILG